MASFSSGPSTQLPCSCSSSTPTGGAEGLGPSSQPQVAFLDFFFPGFSVFSGAVQNYLKIDLNVYIPLLFLLGGTIWFCQYFSEYVWEQVSNYFMSTVDIRTDDEIYNMLMAWVAAQKFSQGARRFVVNTNLNSRSWFLWRWDEDDDAEEEAGPGDDVGSSSDRAGRKEKKALMYTPTFGSHYFMYKGHLCIFRRDKNREQQGFLVASEREEISISCFGRDPWLLKTLLLEAREQFMKRDVHKTLIYRGTLKSESSEPIWQRCMARTSRPFSTVILNEKVKQDLIDDVTDYLDPATRRWYSNRGIPYRRGYLLYGPPGTGKSSLSLALAGFFKMRIYIVSLSSITSNEENLATLFTELPRRCVVLLEDIDTAGLTHTREDGKDKAISAVSKDDDMVPGQITTGTNPTNTTNPPGRLSLSGLLNILDGVASQEGRVLIMTTNHVEKLDKALIRPGRVDMIVEFGLSDRDMIASIFRAIFAPLEVDDPPPSSPTAAASIPDPGEVEKLAEAGRARRDEAVAKVEVLAQQFAERIPAHEFSPAELQGYLLKNKRHPEVAVEGAEAWVVEARKEKAEKQLREAVEKRKKEEEEKKEAAEKRKKEEEEKKKAVEVEKEEKKKAKKAEKKKERKSKKSRKSGSESEASSESDSESGSDIEKGVKKEEEKKGRGRGKEKEEGDNISSEKEQKAETSAATTGSVSGSVKVEEKHQQCNCDGDSRPHTSGSTCSDSGYSTR